MLRLYGCLVEQHDLRLVALAALICVFSSALAVEMITRARQGRESRAAWSALAAATFGAGVWATHFVAELAYDPGLSLGYALGLTGLSILVAMALAALGIFVALRYDAPLSGGAVIGGAIGAMHYVGMAALRVPASIRWDMTYVLSSLAVGMLLSAAAVQALWSGTGPRPRLAATGLLVAAIVALHFTGMAAMTLTPEAVAELTEAIAAPKLLAVAVAAVTATIMAFGLAGLIGTHFARRMAHEAERLRRSKERLIDAIETLPAGFALYDADGRFVLCNTRYRTIYAESADLMQRGASFADIVRIGAERGNYKLGEGGVQAWMNDRLARWANPAEPFEQQLATGEWLRITDRRTSDGGMICVREDITELKRREATFRALFASNPLPMMVYDFKTLRFLEVNDAAVAHYGYGRSEFLAMTLTQIRASEEPQTPSKSGPTARHFGVTRHRTADGRAITVEVTSHQLAFEGRSAGLMIAIDVTDKRRAEDEARESAVRLSKSERHLARAQELAEVGSFEGDLDTGEIVWSDNLYHMLGVDKASFVVNMKSVLAVIHPEDRDRFIAWRAGLRNGHDIPSLRYRVIRADGELRHHFMDADPIGDGSGTVVGLFGTVRDVTAAKQAEEQRRALEAQLQHSQRLEALGTLAGGVAHDLNNTLVPVVALAKMAMKRLPDDSRDYANMATVLRAGERARDLVRQILAFSRKDAPTRQLVDLGALLRESLRMVRASIQSTITFEETVEDVPPIHGDPAQLHQIIINLVVNAAQAIGTAMGTITVRLALDPALRLAETADGPRRPAIRLTVRDTGCGMEEATMRRIFEPFFTTKPVGEGTGLGLSVVHGIVSQHGGRMAVDSRLGEGTVFDVHLPAAADKADRSAA